MARRKAVGGDEVDAFDRKLRRWYRWRPGARSALKRKANKRDRKAARTQAREQTG